MQEWGLMESNQWQLEHMQMKLLHNSTNTKKCTRIKHPNSVSWWQQSHYKNKLRRLDLLEAQIKEQGQK